jgi:uncharacterized protein (DUF2147 family)
MNLLAAAGVVFASFLASAVSLAAATAEGLWRTVDDKTDKPRALVRISERDGVLSGRIERLLDPDPKGDGRCDRCRDERKDQPILGMIILSDLRKEGDRYAGGRILDPENGNVYRCNVRVIDGGKKLEVRGYIGVSFIGRTQVWLREQP